jgi:hypothetical protein
VISCPALASSQAAVTPASPAPMTAMRMLPRPGGGSAPP